MNTDPTIDAVASDPVAPGSPRPTVHESMEGAVGVSVDELSALIALGAVKNLGPQKFKEMHEAGLDAATVLRDPTCLPTKGKRGDELRGAVASMTPAERELALDRATRAIAKAFELRARILTYRSESYPPSVYASNNPVEALYVLGPTATLARLAVACVGSREIRAPYADAHAGFARVAVGERIAVVSGFATGADRIGHEAAWAAGGETVCIMPCGLDRPFPPENRDLWTKFLQSDRAAFVSEFPFGTGASSLTLRKRNKLIVAFAAGVLVSQSSAKGGAMNAFRFAVEQKKPVATFEPDDTDTTSGNRAIGEETKVPTRRLPVGDEAAMIAWLRTLSSST